MMIQRHLIVKHFPWTYSPKNWEFRAICELATRGKTALLCHVYRLRLGLRLPAVAHTTGGFTGPSLCDVVDCCEPPPFDSRSVLWLPPDVK
ncbi:hypothetical protein TNCV_25571 [Trichonephila clavipes]|uniref:Uncharacterized protein n=1 Tax=Trichonephila clavipes TaxID=2585209 RepID=A0A8X6W175_TRICX|nr:hypothetical protein TNCV_25571 [Trichonephila clavipes]